MARKFYRGLTKTENARCAKHAYRLTGDAEERVCIVFYSDWCPTKWDHEGRVVEYYHVYHIKDAETGQHLSVDTRCGGYIQRKAPFQPSWVH